MRYQSRYYEQLSELRRRGELRVTSSLTGAARYCRAFRWCTRCGGLWDNKVQEKTPQGEVHTRGCNCDLDYLQEFADQEVAMAAFALGGVAAVHALELVEFDRWWNGR